MTLTHDLTQEIWPAPPGTASKDKVNVRLGIAYMEFLTWAKDLCVERLGTISFICDCDHDAVCMITRTCTYVHAVSEALPAGVQC